VLKRLKRRKDLFHLMLISNMQSMKGKLPTKTTVIGLNLMIETKVKETVFGTFTKIKRRLLKNLSTRK